MAGRVTAVTGFEKGSGKTTFLGLALPRARAAGPVAVFTIGVDGRLAGRERGRAPDIRVEAGDVVMTTESFARASGARFEVLETMPGRTALGPLMLGRARRAGSVTLVGCEHLSALARAVDLVREEAWARSALIDGAVNRVTQVGALGDVRFVFTARVNPANVSRVAGRVRAIHALSRLPLAGVDPRGPGVDPRGPGADPRGPGADPRGPGVDPRGPGVDPRGPGADPRGPGVDPRGPGADPGGPGVDPRGPGVDPRGREADPCAGLVVVEGPLTPERLEALPPGTTRLSIEDFTKVFLDPSVLLRALERYAFEVRRRLELLCFCVALQDVSREAFARAVGPEAAPHLLLNPLEVR